MWSQCRMRSCNAAAPHRGAAGALRAARRADAGGMAAIDVCTIRMWTLVNIDGIFGVAVPTRHFFFAMTMGSRFQQMLEKSSRPIHAREHSSGAAALEVARKGPRS